MSLSDLEGQALQNMINEKGYLWRALEKFFVERAARYDSMCSSKLRPGSRDIEQACDYAAKSDEAALTMAQLESFARDL